MSKRKCIYIFDEKISEIDMIVKNLNRYFDSVNSIDIRAVQRDFKKFKSSLVSFCREYEIYLAGGAFLLNDNIYGFFDYCGKAEGNTVILNSKEQLMGDGKDAEYIPRDIAPFFVIHTDEKNISEIGTDGFASVGAVSETFSSGAVSYFGTLIKNDDMIDLPPIAFSNYEYIDSYHYPAFFLDAFRIGRPGMIRYGSDGDLRKLYSAFSVSGDEGSLDEFILSRYDAAVIKDLLNLDISTGIYGTDCSRENIKCGAFIHLYYPDLFSEYARYIENIPEWIDIYISSDTEAKLGEIKNILSVRTVSHTRFIKVNPRGRDVSALLVGMKKAVLRYDRILFIHDKKSHEGECFTVGKAFNRDMWDNLIGENDNICRIMKIFDSHERIGILTAPPPYYGVYADVGGDFWTICYQKTKELLESLGIDITPDRNTDPITLGMSFWCRTDALLPLFERNWKYDDFQSEPMDLDGTISHAIERSLAYIAQSKGYFTAWVFMQDNLLNYMQSSHCMLSRFKRKLIKEKTVEKYANYDMFDVLSDKGSLHYSLPEDSFGVAKALNDFKNAFGALCRSFLRKIKR